MENNSKTFQNASVSKGFAQIAETIFTPIYPVIAEQILADTCIRAGTALDMGYGPGHLATSLTAVSDLNVYALDISANMIQICGERIHKAGMCNRVIPVKGDVSAIPFDENTFDLVVSRGSWFFWENLTQGLHEAYRVLKIGGVAFIGGGFGNLALKKEIIAAMKKVEPGFEDGMKERIQSMPPERVKKSLDCVGITNYSIINDETGYWVRMVRS